MQCTRAGWRQLTTELETGCSFKWQWDGSTLRPRNSILTYFMLPISQTIFRHFLPVEFSAKFTHKRDAKLLLTSTSKLQPATRKTLSLRWGKKTADRQNSRLNVFSITAVKQKLPQNHDLYSRLDFKVRNWRFIQRQLLLYIRKFLPICHTADKISTNFYITRHMRQGHSATD